MSSLVLEKVEKENIHVYLEWNKGETFTVSVGYFMDSIQCGRLLFNGIYSTLEQAKRAFKRQVLKLKNN